MNFITRLIKKIRSRDLAVLHDDDEVIGDTDFDNVKRIKEKARICEFCNNKKMIKYKIKETKDYHRLGLTKMICGGCLEFILGMHWQGQMGVYRRDKQGVE